MRRVIPILIVIVGLLALGIDIVDLFGAKLTNPITSQPIETRLGLDLQGGLRVEYQVLPAEGRSPGASDIATVAGIIDRRVNSTGTTEPLIQTQGADRIVVELPGASDIESIRKLVGSTGRLEFVPLPADQYGTVNAPGAKSVAAGEPIDPALVPLFSGSQIAEANPSYDQQTQERAVAFKLKDDGKNKFATYTQSHINEFFAIVLDGTVMSAPYIKSAITDGSGQISGSFTAAEMNNLVTTLRYGALPFPLQEVSVQSIAATLGIDFLRRSIIAGLIGIGLVVVFMLGYYRLPGAVASIALAYYTLLVFAIFRFIPVTLTLAGVAAFVLSVGMAVDANVLIFERTREELRAGKTLQPAIEAGFNRAWNSIFDSNVSSLITASILFYFGSSTIRGFALVFIIGVLASMFTAITVSRTVLRQVVRWDWARQARLYGVREEEFVTATPRGIRSRGVSSRV
jgi:protein-export membrane protein SecD